MEVILPFVGMFVGAIITWWAARHYYEKASRDLASEATELKKLTTLLLRGLESGGIAEFSRDNEGNIKGMIIKVTANLQARPASMTGECSGTSENE